MLSLTPEILESRARGPLNGTSSGRTEGPSGLPRTYTHLRQSAGPPRQTQDVHSKTRASSSPAQPEGQRHAPRPSWALLQPGSSWLSARSPVTRPPRTGGGAAGLLPPDRQSVFRPLYPTHQCVPVLMERHPTAMSAPQLDLEGPQATRGVGHGGTVPGKRPGEETVGWAGSLPPSPLTIATSGIAPSDFSKVPCTLFHSLA